MLRLGKIVALLSFLIGTVLLLSFLYNLDLRIAFFSQYFIAGACLVNFIVFVLILFFSDRTHKDLKKTILLMLLNIPISLVYLYIVLLQFRNLD